MIIDSHEHIMFPVKMQLDKMDMESLNNILAGSSSMEDRITRMKNNILEVF